MTRFDELNGLKWTTDDLEKKFSNTYVEATLFGNSPVKPLLEKTLVFIRHGAYGHDNFDLDNNQPIQINSALIRYPKTGDPNKDWTEGQFPYSKIFITNERADPCITNYNQTAVLFRYNPERQWKRGFGSHNSFVYFAPNVKHHQPQAWQNMLAYRILYPEHMHIDDAMKWFAQNPEGSARALNNLYWLIRTDGVIKLYRRRAFIGSFIGNRFFSREDARIFEEELKMELPILRKSYAKPHSAASH